jgi:hypothetical protein
MTFHSNLDVWQEESLRSSCVRPLRAIDIIRLAASGAFGDISLPTGPAGAVEGGVAAMFAQAWRRIICRKIDWAAERCAKVWQATLKALKLLDQGEWRHARVEPRGCVSSEAEVNANASA